MLPIHTWMSELSSPLPYQPGDESIWTDPHIAGEMLKAHLAPDTDAASYRPETLRAICEFLPARMDLKPGAKVVDLGCGPGLYSHRLADMGYVMTGIDWSENSIRHAENLCEGQSTRFRRASYLDPFGSEEYDAALLISKDFGVLSPAQRKALLKNIRDALRPGGMFAFDLHGMADYEMRRQNAAPTWRIAEAGFWRPHPHVALETTYFYPEISATCDLHAVLDDRATIYRVWQTYFTPDAIRRELREGGFEILGVYASLAGDALGENSPTLGVIAKKI